MYSIPSHGEMEGASSIPGSTFVTKIACAALTSRHILRQLACTRPAESGCICLRCLGPRGTMGLQMNKVKPRPASSSHDIYRKSSAWESHTSKCNLTFLGVQVQTELTWSAIQTLKKIMSLVLLPMSCTDEGVIFLLNPHPPEVSGHLL